MGHTVNVGVMVDTDILRDNDLDILAHHVVWLVAQPFCQRSVYKLDDPFAGGDEDPLTSWSAAH